MIIKLTANVNDTPAGSIVEVDDAVGQALIDEGKAELYTDEAKSLERKIAIKAFATGSSVAVEVIQMSKENEIKAQYGEHYIGKAFLSLAGKAVSGMSEGTAASGGALITTALGEITGIAMAGSVVYNKCRKLTLPQQANSIKIPVDISDPWIKANVPVPTNPAEAVQKTPTVLQFDPRTLTLGKTVLYIPVTDELLQDVRMLDGYVRQYAQSKLAGVLDYEILAGGAGGFTAISGDANYCSTTGLTTPTVAELYQFVNQIDPRLQSGAEWFIAPAYWSTIAGVVLSAENLDKQIGDVNAKTLFGRPVNVIPGLAAGKVILANLSQYTVVAPEINDVIAVSEHIRFDYDETVYRLVSRNAGAMTWRARTATDTSVIGAAVEES